MLFFLTSTLSRQRRVATVLLLLGQNPIAAASSIPPKNAPTEPPALQITEANFEIRREGGSRLTWTLQRLLLANGNSILTLAGLQFEEALGLSILVLDPPPMELFSTQGHAVEGELKALESNQLKPSKFREDIPSSNEKRLPGEPARADIQLKNIVVDLKDLLSLAGQTPGLKELPACDKGRRRAVAFIRPGQMARQLDLDIFRATELSRYGRAACVRWDDFPPESTPQTKNSNQSEFPHL